MVLLSQATNLVSFFVAIETLSIPLYILCAANMRRERSLESGLKYLIVGSLGSATLLYGMAFLYGGSGSTDFSGIAAGISQKGVLGDPLVLVGIGMTAVGLAFKTSVAPFHQWTPDVYEGAPTPITGFMAVATKAAAFAVFVRFFDIALAPQANEWQPALAVLAAISIVVGNIGALGQDSLKRLLGYSGIAQAGYILCAANMRRERSLESGLKYLIVGSLGSATLLYGMAFLYGGSGSTDFSGIATGISQKGVLGDPLVLVGIGMTAVGLAFKTSVAPFHQWTPDVYEGAPTPITGFMAVATKAAAFAVFVRFFDVALAPQVSEWQPALAVLAAISIVVGNVGALGQDSLKRLLGYSGIAQAGYILGGLVVASEAGVNALVFYLAGYAFMNLAAFAVVVARERETPYGDDIRAMQGLGRERPLLAWPLTISMLGLAGMPATVGFIGKLYLIEALVEGDYTWLAVFIAVGTMISLAYYLRVVATMWMRPGGETAATPAIAGASPEADPIDPEAGRRIYLAAPALLAAAAVVFFGVIPQPLVEFAEHAGSSLF
jgi:NADH-quinone oxidoreductase subunit N